MLISLPKRVKSITGLMLLFSLLFGCRPIGSSSTEVPSSIPVTPSASVSIQSSPISPVVPSAEVIFNGVRITYVSNEGILITVRDKKILIDALFLSGIPKELPELLVNAMPPFDGVDLILITHDHNDHYNASMVEQYLQVNPKAFVVSTAQVTSKLSDYKDRVITLNATDGNPNQVIINNIQVKAFYLTHGDSRGVINYGYLITVYGIKLFHAGDYDNTQSGRSYLKPYKLTEENIDIAFLPYWMPTMFAVHGEGGIGSRYVIPIHYQFYEIPFIIELTNTYRPDAIFFEYNLQNWVMPAMD